MTPDGPDSPPGAAEGASSAAGRQTVARVRLYLALLLLFYCSTLALSLAFSLRSAAQRYEELALFSARSFFRQVVVTRRWNALHGGVYVPVTAATQPNPYLEDPLRDVVTTDGQQLTKLNPAYMTRLISEVMNQQGDATFHMTSLKPIRPENAPDAWEREALLSFEQGASERAALVGSGETATYRYIAPLKTEASCLNCHAKQGYRLGDIRGGIGITIPYRPFDAIFAQQRRESYIRHLLFFAVGLGYVLALGGLLLRRVRDLQESGKRIYALEGLLPICASCKKIRAADGDYRDQAAWEPVESYIQHRSDVTFTHGMCPECARAYYGDLGKR
jgi:two-component system NtrC family sensor kinase